VELFMSQ